MATTRKLMRSILGREFVGIRRKGGTRCTNRVCRRSDRARVRRNPQPTEPTVEVCKVATRRITCFQRMVRAVQTFWRARHA